MAKQNKRQILSHRLLPPISDIVLSSQPAPGSDLGSGTLSGQVHTLVPDVCGVQVSAPDRRGTTRLRIR